MSKVDEYKLTQWRALRHKYAGSISGPDGAARRESLASSGGAPSVFSLSPGELVKRLKEADERAASEAAASPTGDVIVAASSGALICV